MYYLIVLLMTAVTGRNVDSDQLQLHLICYLCYSWQLLEGTSVSEVTNSSDTDEPLARVGNSINAEPAVTDVGAKELPPSASNKTSSIASSTRHK